jgi:tripartite-type tricarboxylate transporter receptor subunit TctC
MCFISLAARVGVVLLLTTASLNAQSDADNFYKGKTIKLIIGGSAGGGFDTYARLLARYMPKYIPGNPTIVPSNMPGGGGNIAAGHLYNLGSKDGTVFAAVLPGSITDPLLQSVDRVKHDPSRLIYLGSANSEVNMCYVRSDTGIKSLKDLAEKEVIIGASAEGGSTRDQPTIQKNLLGSKFKIVSGYPGTREIFLAIEKNEVSGICGIGLSSFRAQRPAWLDNGFMRIISQDNAEGDPNISRLGVLRTIDLARSEDDKKVMELLYSQQDFGRPYILPPDVPPERVAILRRAFDQALADSELLAMAAKMKIEISPVTGENLQKQVERLYAMPPEIVERAKKALVAD